MTNCQSTPAIDGTERYFRDFVLPMCRHVGDSGQLIAILQGQVEEWSKEKFDEAKGPLRALRTSLLLIEGRQRLAASAAA